MHTGAWFMYINVSQAFGFTLDVLCMIFVCCVTLSFLIFDTSDINGASVGLAITQSMALTMMLQWGIRQSAEVMNQMMAVERVLEYRELGTRIKKY
jgi:ATP-binding cassette subfamily C (CFTR/MRP) protein 4